MQPIYLDHNATTPTRPEVADAIARCLAEGHANPASQHQPGQRARRRWKTPASKSPKSSAATSATSSRTGSFSPAAAPRPTTSPSWGSPSRQRPATRGIARSKTAPGQIVISAIEHASVIEPAERLLEQGWRLDTLGVDAAGLIRTDHLAPLLSPQTRLVSATLGNHETGVLQPIAEMAAICNRFGVPLHSDAVAVAGKLPIDFRRLGLAAMSIAAHKFQGPRGHCRPVASPRRGGAADPLRRPSAARPASGHGAGRPGRRHGRGAGTLAAEQDAELRRLTALRDRLEAGLLAGCPDAVIHSRSAPRLPHMTNIAFPGLDGQVLLLALDMAGVACSVGSACASGSSELSPTLAGDAASQRPGRPVRFV